MIQTTYISNNNSIAKGLEKNPSRLYALDFDSIYKEEMTSSSYMIIHISFFIHWILNRLIANLCFTKQILHKTNDTKPVIKQFYSL